MAILTPRIARNLQSLSSCRRASRNIAFQRRNISAYGYEQAKALVFYDYGEPKDVLHLHSHSISPAHSTLATLRFLASPLNPADVNTIQGVYPSKPPFTTSLTTATPAAVPGNEGVAEIISVGSNAADSQGQRLTQGDWVIMKGPGFGTWRTHAQGEGRHLVRLSEEDREGITAVQAGTVSVNPCTAYAMLKGFVGGGEEQSGKELKAGEWFVQNGANSGVGRAAIQLGREWGLKSINVIRSRPGGEEETQTLKRELMELGADVVVTEEEAGEKGWADFVKEKTNGGREKVALAMNCVGGRSALNLSKVLSSKAWLLTYGAMAKQPLTIPAGMLIFKDLRFAGFWVSRWSDVCPHQKRVAVKEVLKLTREGKFTDIPSREIPWEHKTPEGPLKDAVQDTLEGYKGGKGIFVFSNT